MIIKERFRYKRDEECDNSEFKCDFCEESPEEILELVKEDGTLFWACPECK